MNMKKLAVVMCVAWMGAGAFALSFLGPPTAELEKTTRTNDKGKEVSRWEDRWGYTFSFSKMDIDVAGETLKDTELTRHYLTWGIALDENFNFNVLLGTVSGKADKGDINDAVGGPLTTSDFDGDNGFSYGFNLKSTFHHGEKVDWGAMVQMTFFSTEDTVDGVSADLNDAWDLQVAVGPTVDMGGWKLYGGGYYYMLEADLDISGVGSIDVEEEDNFGGFIGAQIPLMENLDLGVEYQMGNNSSNIGFTVGMRF